VRDSCPLDHVIDADADEPALLELDDAGLEQLAYRLAPLCPQFAILCGGTAAE
jgi:hypothetical protein